MNKDQLEGKRKQAAGSVTDAKGDVKGSTGDNLKGKAQKAAGKVQEGYGNMKEKAKDGSTRR